MDRFQPFELERIMDRWETHVDFNLSESGVHPITLRELLSSPSAINDLMDTRFAYPECNGTSELRQAIAAMYPGASSDNVLVTVGCAEANFTATQTLLRPGDGIVVMVPNYLQIWGLANNFGFDRKPFHLVEDEGWAPDISELNDMVSDRTRMIAVCNPNNPTGRILTEPEMDAIVATAERVGAWILADETYAGTERNSDVQTPSFWGRYPKVVVTASLSKAYGLPGLRAGWVVGPADVTEEIWMRHEYTTISTTILTNRLAAIALSPQVRSRLIARGRNYVRKGFPVLDVWLHDHPGVFSLVPPQAAAIACVRYDLDINSTVLAEQLIAEKSVFVVPGDCFGIDRHVRIGFGMEAGYLKAALDRFHEFIVGRQ